MCLRLGDPSLEIPTNDFAFNIGMFRLDSQCTGELNTTPTCHNSCLLVQCHSCAEGTRAPWGQCWIGGGTFSKHI